MSKVHLEFIMCFCAQICSWSSHYIVMRNSSQAFERNLYIAVVNYVISAIYSLRSILLKHTTKVAILLDHLRQARRLQRYDNFTIYSSHRGVANFPLLSLDIRPFEAYYYC